MVDERVKKYLSEGIKKGYTINSLKEELEKKGFQEKIIFEAENSLKKPEEQISYKNRFLGEENSIIKKKIIETKQKETNYEKLGFFKKIKKGFTNQEELIEKTRGEGILKVLGFYIILFLSVSIIISIISMLIFGTIIATTFEPLLGAFSLTIGSLMMLILGIELIFLVIIMPILLIISAGIYHLSIKLFKGKGKFKNTFRIMIYTAIPLMILGFVPILNIGLMIWIFIKQLRFLSEEHEITKMKVFLAGIIMPIIIYGIITLIFFLLK